MRTWVRTVVFAAVVIAGGSAMALGKTVTIASAMSGQLVDGSGQPAAGVKVTRRWSYSDNSGTDSTMTDTDGRFAFSAVERRSFWAGLIPHNPVIDQQFLHTADKGETLFLQIFKRDYAPNGERDGRPLNVVCRTDRDATPGPGDVFLSTCDKID